MPYYHVTGRNRYSKALVVVQRNIRTEKEARETMKAVKEGSGKDYTYKLSSSHLPWD